MNCLKEPHMLCQNGLSCTMKCERNQPSASPSGYGGCDLEAMRRELTDGFIYREYAQLFAPLKPDYMESAIGLYRNDANFHARVQQVVYGVMQIVQKYTP